jgi:hypothetical protein
MVNVSLRKVSDSASEVRFANPRMVGWVFVAAGVGAGTLGVTGAASNGPWMAVLGGGLLVLPGLALILYRFELILDFAARRYLWKRGMPFSLRTGSGSLEEIEGVRLDQEWETRGSGKNRRDVCTWEVRLLFTSDPGPVKVVDRADDVRVRREAEELARRLDRPLVDATGSELVTVDASDLDLNVRERFAREGVERGDWHDPPPGSGIECGVEAGRRRIHLARRGVDVGVAFMVLFGAVFGAMGLGAVRDSPFGDPVPQTLLGALFALVGGSIALGGWVRGWRRQWIRDEGSALVVGSTLAGVRFASRRIPKGEIEGVDMVRSSTHGSGGMRLRVGGIGVAAGHGGRRDEVRIRSDEDVVRLGGHLSEEEKGWLRDALIFLAAR